MKRVIDLTISLVALLLLSPLIIILAILVRFKMGSPILFTQERPGLNGEPFYLYKFRTMKDLRDSQGNPLSDELRLTSFGKLLRKYSLDEFPQLLNVVKGEMSLVGPRPFLMEYLPLYTEDQMKRHNVKPGITGWAQVNGRNAITWEEKFNLDIWYVKNQSLLLDLKILTLTAIKVTKKEGISQQGQVTMEKFNGSNEVM
ncbi:sugar transferase [Bacillus sp. AFS055030]|uniref:sugar transferase n=1 Tax=Bacillus sp. AFS055030 TaxID=2033507 RepID=UPI000BFBF7B1|nr:sugar transferase [Bacillus sp. AFS055030]PGL70325.1 sugar transferase [Bacillus sp. AFS055030]